jgi:hypothetical protein
MRQQTLIPPHPLTAGRTFERREPVASEKSGFPTCRVIIAAGVIIETSLSLRLWAQLTNRAETGMLGTIMDATNRLASPFKSFVDQPATHGTGIFDVSTLAAIEAYLVGTLVLLFLVVLARNSWKLGAHFYHASRKPALVGVAARQGRRVAEPSPPKKPAEAPLVAVANATREESRVATEGKVVA